MIPRLKEQFKNELKSKVMDQLSLENVNEIPTLEKIVINIGDGKAATDGRALESMVDELTAISGQKPVIRRAKKSIAGFKIREGMPIGVSVTLRGDRMWEFYDRFVQVVIPRIRDFRGFNKKSFDGNGNYSLGLNEQLVFPEVEYDKVRDIRGMNINDKDNVLVFDDCDSVFSDELSLNILKAALDSKKNRTIHWNTDSFKLRNEGVPDSFDFKGGAIFITNIKFDNVKSKKMRDHLEALESRCHYIDLTIDTDREKMLRIKQITKDGMLDEYALGEGVVDEIVEFCESNKARLRELSLRTVLKVADLAKAFPTKWEAMAENTVMKH